MTIENIQISEQDPVPLYKQIANAIAAEIEHGSLKANDKLPTHRSLAEQLGVTVGTVTRAYAEAERRGLVEARVGAGTFVVDKQKDYWAFDSEEAPSDRQGEKRIHECNFGYNIPPLVDRSDMLKKAMLAISGSTQALNQFMVYQKPTGIESHRQITARWLQDKGVKISAERMLFSSGAQHAMQMVMDAFTKAGDTILTEKLTYPGLFSLARQKQLTIKGVDIDCDGMLPESLDAACRQFQARFVYLTPTLQNPTTAVMPEKRRKEIIKVCQQHDLIIIEDDVNGLLPENPPSPMVNMDPERVIHIGAFSKCLAPGLRVGYLQPPEKLYRPLSIALQNHSWMISPLLTALTCELIQSGDADRILSTIREELKQRIKLALEYLQPFAPRTQPISSHFWLPLPEQWRLSDFVDAAAKQGVIVKSAEQFTPPAGNITPAVRLAISSPINQTQMLYGLKTLKQLLESDPMCDFAL